MQVNDTIIIKKYKNRKLYNTTTNKYINLDEVIDLMRDGSKVEVYSTKRVKTEFQHT